MEDKLPPIVEVKWKDSWSSNTRWTAEELKREGDFIMSSTGYLMHRDKRGINLCGEYRRENKTGRQIQHIPARMILKVRRLK